MLNITKIKPTDYIFKRNSFIGEKPEQQNRLVRTPANLRCWERGMFRKCVTTLVAEQYKVGASLNVELNKQIRYVKFDRSL